jgi:hypothetical protein
VALLSLDVVLPFHALFGLRLPGPPAFLAEVRGVILSNREAFLRNPDTIPALRDTLLRTIAARFGDAASDHLRRWILTVFEVAPSDHPDWMAWQLTLMLVGGTASSWARLRLPADRESALYQTYVQARDRQKVETLCEELQGKPLSDWDLEMFSIHHWDMADEGTDPLVLVRSACANYRFQVFWAELLRGLDAGEQEHLWESARKVRRDRGLDQDKLVAPRSLKGIGS